MTYQQQNKVALIAVLVAITALGVIFWYETEQNIHDDRIFIDRCIASGVQPFVCDEAARRPEGWETKP